MKKTKQTKKRNKQVQPKVKRLLADDLLQITGGTTVDPKCICCLE